MYLDVSNFGVGIGINTICFGRMKKNVFEKKKIFFDIMKM